MKTVAVLYCDPRGPYPSLSVPGIWLECWGLPHRDAKQYDGPWPVVAHPPCGPWSKLRHLYRGNEHDCAPRAVEQVRKFGGVLEHPAGSMLWDAAHGMNLPKPHHAPDCFGGRTVEVDQCDWGHVARKKTWLYMCGPSTDALETPEKREPTHWCSGFRSAGADVGASGYKRQGCAVPEGIKVCSAQQRRRTPPDFARYLVKLAASVTRPRSTGEAVSP